MAVKLQLSVAITMSRARSVGTTLPAADCAIWTVKETVSSPKRYQFPRIFVYFFLNFKAQHIFSKLKTFKVGRL